MANPQDLSYYWTAGQVQPLTAVASSSSSQSVNEPSVEGPARKKRRKDDNDLYFRSDAEVWDLEDMEILAASQAHWTSEAYPHYNVALERNQQTRELIFRFTCKHDEQDHSKHTYRRSRTKDHHGTTNLLRTAKRCDVRRGVRPPDQDSADMTIPIPQYNSLSAALGGAAFPPASSPSSSSSIADAPQGSAPPLPSALGHRRRDPDNIADKKDEEVWHLEDHVILEASRARWSSKAYGHYNVSVDRVEDNKEIFFRFVCKYREADHVKSNYRRSRMKAHHGTTSLLHSAERCDARRGVESDLISHRIRQEASSGYNPYMYRALLTLRCSVSKLPFDFVANKFFIMEAQMLRPGIVVPSPQALEQDMLFLYQRYRTEITQYFHVRARSVHIVYEEWPSRVHEFSGALILVWEDEGKINRSIGSLARIGDGTHDSDLAFAINKCTSDYDLSAFIRADNGAGHANIDPQLSASSSLNRNFDHTIVLISETLRSFFTSDASAELANIADRTVYKKEKSTIDVVRDDAKVEMADRNVVAKDAEVENARNIISKMLSLVDRVRKSKILQICFRQHIASGIPLTIPEEVIAVFFHEPREKTWTSELQLVHACLVLKKPISDLITDPDVTLSDYQFLTQQWTMLGEIYKLLSGFEEVKDRFKVGSVTLLVDAIPALQSLMHLLKITAENALLHSVTRIAALAGTLICRRDYNPSQGYDEPWALSIVMCPNMNLKFFEQTLQWPSERVATLRQRAVDYFNEHQHADVEPSVVDDIQYYLEQPPITTIANGFDVLNYWQSQLQTLPRLARMGLSFTSIPANTTDIHQVGPTEQVNFDSSGMSVQTFEAIMSLGSWHESPWFSLEKAAHMLEEGAMRY